MIHEKPVPKPKEEMTARESSDTFNRIYVPRDIFSGDMKGLVDYLPWRDFVRKGIEIPKTLEQYIWTVYYFIEFDEYRVIPGAYEKDVSLEATGAVIGYVYTEVPWYKGSSQFRWRY